MNDNITNELIKRDIEHVHKDDACYPDRLRGIKGAPKELYYIGSLPDPDIPSVAIIGARNCSGYGRQMAREFAREIASAGIQVISGMAMGIDGIAGQSALAVGGRSYAVLGSGVDICYPKDNARLYENLLSLGGVISEYTPGTPARAAHFPARNRIISGLSDAVLVIEARERSGTLITVGMALEQGRDVYVLPGRVTDSLSYGCNQLIRDGAIPLLRPYEFVDDFLSRYSLISGRYAVGTGTESQRGVNMAASKTAAATDDRIKESERFRFMTKKERQIIGVLDYRPKTVSEIFYELSDKTDIPIQELLGLLTGMTLRHLIDCIDGSNYCIRG